MQAHRIDPLSAIVPLLRYRALRVLLVAAPGVTAAVAILTATESNLVTVFVLNVAVGVIISSTIFLAVSLAAREVGNERMNLARATEEGQWRARAQLISISNDETGLYADWYFHLRLQEEIDRAARYDTHFAVLIVTPLESHQDFEMEAASVSFGNAIRTHLRSSDMAALLRDGRLAVLLPHTSRQSLLKRRLIKVLKSIDARVGLAFFPGDGKDAAGLLSTAAANGQPSDDARQTTRFSLPA